MKEKFSETHEFDFENICYGFRRMMWGYFKKLVISERFSQIVSGIFTHYTDFGALDIIIAVLCYIIQLYTDFSGCIDIISGVSRLFGIKLPENFRAPIFYSSSFREFWQKWHITLGLWFKDYVMYPLQISQPMVNLHEKSGKFFSKNIAKKIPFYISLFTLWFLIGIWHGGSAYYFIGAGMAPFLILLIFDLLKPVTNKLIKQFNINTNSFLWLFIQRTKTIFLVAICWFFICASSAKNGFRIIHYALNSLFEFNIINKFDTFCIEKFSLILMVFGVLILFFAEYLENKGKTIFDFVDNQKPVFRYSIIYVEILLIMLFGKIGSSAFIYFKF